MADDASPPWDEAAVLVWVAPGSTPAAGRLDHMHVQTPPHPNPTPFWRYSDAVEHATETLMNARHSGKEPWIKVRDALFGPLDVAAHYRAIVAARGRA